LNDASAIWSGKPPDGFLAAVGEILGTAVQKNNRIVAFFRADDIAGVDERFRLLMHLFNRHQIPLNLAVVPQWLTAEQWEAMQRFSPDNPLWCWHQHGWNHSNHEVQGKKSEFGPARTREDIRLDLLQGRNRLKKILGGLFCPVFTPPWNRCSTITLELLEELDFLAVSRAKTAKPPYAGKLPDLAVNVDLHTRREKDGRQGWENLLAEFSEAAQSGQIGVMLHHQRMNDAAFDFLANLLSLFQKQAAIACTTFRQLL